MCLGCMGSGAEFPGRWYPRCPACIGSGTVTEPDARDIQRDTRCDDETIWQVLTETEARPGGGFPRFLVLGREANALRRALTAERTVL